MRMTQEYLVVGLTEGDVIEGRPEICTQEEYVEKQRKAKNATDGNWSWVILSHIQVEDGKELLCTKCGRSASEFDEEVDFCDASIGESPADRCNGRFEKREVSV